MGGLKAYPEMKDSGVPWLGEVPAHWSAASVKRHYAIQLGKMLQNRPEGPADAEVDYLKAQHVQWFSVRTSPTPRMWASPRDMRQYGVVNGDLLVCEGGEGGRAGIVRDVSSRLIIQNALHRVRPHGQCSNEYLQYLMSAVSATGWFDAISSKATIAHFTREKFGALAITVPSPREQAGIVRFLNHADRRIRRCIRAKQKLIKLLEEQNQAIIHRAVTRGLDPNVRLKPSGVEWLGDLPEHWEVGSVGRMASLVTSGSRGWADYYSEDGDIFIQSGNLGRSLSLDFSYTQHVTPPPGAEGVRTTVRRNDVLVCITGALTGNVVVVDVVLPKRAFVNQHVALVRPKQELVWPRFLAFALRSEVGQSQFKSSEYGGTKQGLGLDDVKSTLIPLPPLAEQIALCLQIDEALRATTSAISSAEREISLLREYRTRLIADVVTGKLDVREAAARLPQEVEDLEPLDESEVEGDAEDSDAGDGDGVPEEVDA